MTKTSFEVRTPAPFSGPWSVCITRTKPADVRDFERRWHRGRLGLLNAAARTNLDAAKLR